MSEDTRPKFWLKEVFVPEKACRKMDPSLFLNNYLDPFMIELGRAIVTAKRVGKAFTLEAHIRFAEYLEIGVTNGKKEDAAESTNDKSFEEVKPVDSGTGARPVPNREED